MFRFHVLLSVSYLPSFSCLTDLEEVLRILPIDSDGVDKETQSRHGDEAK